MENISRQAKDYYVEFEKNDWRNMPTWVSLLAWLAFFVVGLYTFFSIFAFNDIEAKRNLIWPLMVLELVGLFALEKAKEDRRKTILKKFNRQYSNMYCQNRFLDIDMCKRQFLRVNIGKAENEYLSLAQDINKVLELQEMLRPPLSRTLSQLHLYIYNPDSKPRINALLIMLFSSIIVLSSKEGAGIANVFAFYEGLTPLLTFFLLFYVALLFGFVMLTQSLIGFLWGKIFPEMNLEIRYLMRDLLKFHKVA